MAPDFSTASSKAEATPPWIGVFAWGNATRFDTKMMPTPHLKAKPWQ
jgi:hypothetical protein